MSSVSIDAESLRLLVAEAQHGSRAAAERLIRQHERWVRSAIYAVTGRVDQVDDIAQQVWLRAWQRLGTLDNPKRLRPWLYAIARNAALDARAADRRRQAVAGRLDGQADELDRRQVGPPMVAGDTEGREGLLRSVQALPALYREPFVLRHLEDWSYAEIGETLDLSIETVETRLVRARRLLREMLQGKVDS
jgi:RNA polymerase sigma factor (sigma-70 family)